MRNRISILFSILMFCTLNIKSQQTAKKMVTETNYFLYLPVDYNTDTVKKWPVMFFLHGSGERGDDINRVKKHGPPKLVETKDFSFIIVSPQCRDGEWWKSHSLNKLYKEIIENYRVDEDRIYLTGLSMGGYGTWEWASENPEKFAAIAPICGGGDLSKAWKLRHMPAWVFHGEKDGIVPPEQSRRMIRAMQKYNAKPKMTFYPEAEHDSWTVTYNSDSLYSWFLSNKRKKDIKYDISTDILSGYQGSFLSPENDTIKVAMDKEHLYLETWGRKMQLVPENENTFYIHHWGGNMILFSGDGLTVHYNNEVIKAKKVK